MARITVNTTGTQPHLYVSTDTSNVANASLDITCLQDVTITNSTGIFSWTDFCTTSINKVTTPSDNEVSTNIVIDEDKFMLRALALSDDVGASGYLRLQEGLAAARYEAVSGKRLFNSIDNSWDFNIEGSLEKVSLKGPLL